VRIIGSKNILQVVTLDPDKLRAYILRAKAYKGSASSFLDANTVVRVKCKYCGSMVDFNSPKCPHCGAPSDH
ncbi:MAG: hypothetical protein ACP5NK_07960, partial [Thermoplasmata archaeon]